MQGRVVTDLKPDAFEVWEDKIQQSISYFSEEDVALSLGVIFDISGLNIPTIDFSRELKNRGVLANGINASHMRMLTHYDVSREDCQRATTVVAELADANRQETLEPVPAEATY